MTAFPDWFTPMAATLTEERFVHPDWLYERKFDGIRLLAFRNGTDVTLFSRNHLEQDAPPVTSAIARLPVDNVILDGELLWDQRAYHVFDVLWLDGVDLRASPLTERLARLGALPFTPPLWHVEQLTGDRPWDHACAQGWEGVIAKRRDSVYEHKRARTWLKMKCELVEELVIGGFTDPQGARVGLGALLVGKRDGRDLVYAGKVGTGVGFTAAMLGALRQRLDAIAAPSSPFTRATGLPKARVHWVRPEILVQVAFIEWTDNEKLRHPRLLAVR